MDAIDDVNLATMAASAVVAEYASQGDLFPPERTLLDLVRDEARDQPILDLGVGGGRTVEALRALGAGYIGLDNSEAMVSKCKTRFPHARFELGDARDLSRWPDGHFALVVFSGNGLCMVGHEDRLRVLAELFRVLRPGGAFAFSTFNRRSPDHDAGFQFPEFSLSLNPARVAVRAARFVKHTLLRIRNRRRNLPYEDRCADHSIINDLCHDYGTLLYYLDLSTQRRQLVDAGFEAGAPAYDHDGRLIEHDSVESSLALLARKPR